MVRHALGLRAQQHEILVMRVVVLGVAQQLFGTPRRWWRAACRAVRRGGGKTVERGELLLARSTELGRSERLGHAPRLLGRAPRSKRPMNRMPNTTRRPTRP
jgi:hypothetical protein